MQLDSLDPIVGSLIQINNHPALFLLLFVDFFLRGVLFVDYEETKLGHVSLLLYYKRNSFFFFLGKPTSSACSGVDA